MSWRNCFEADLSSSGREHEPVYRCAILLLSALELGTDLSISAKAIGYSVAFVTQISERMQDAELWIEDQLRCDHWKDGGEYCQDLEFWLDVLIAHGSWAREPVGMGEYSYLRVGPEPEDEAVVH